jgi:5'-nucleotidase
MIDWNAIDTVLFDMDGTLLDLHFDNYFWQHFLPKRYAEQLKIDPQEALIDLYRRFDDKRNSIQWYCTDYWSNELGVNILALKQEIQHLIAERPQASKFLNYLGDRTTTRILITNAHRHSLNLKLNVTGIGTLLDTIISSHDFGLPKEDPGFWPALRRQVNFDPARTLFIDDTEAMLSAAQDYGVRHLLCVSQPDSTKAPRSNLKFPALCQFDDLLR